MKRLLLALFLPLVALADTGGNIDLHNGASLGANSGNDLILYTSSSSDKVKVLGEFEVYADDDANRKLSFTASSDTALVLRWGDGSTASQNLSIAANTVDNSDNGTLYLNGGSGTGTGDLSGYGAYISVAGNEATNEGGIRLVAGNDTNARVQVKLTNSSSFFQLLDSSNNIKFFINNSGVVGLAAQGGLRYAAYVPTMVAGTPTPGTHDLKLGLNAVPTAAAGAAALLPAAPTQGDFVEVLNTGPNEINVCPGSGDTIASGGATGSANTCIGVLTGTRATFVANSASAWHGNVPIAAGMATPGN